jgi:hypothetical protein
VVISASAFFALSIGNGQFRPRVSSYLSMFIEKIFQPRAGMCLAVEMDALDGF